MLPNSSVGMIPSALTHNHHINRQFQHVLFLHGRVWPEPDQPGLQGGPVKPSKNVTLHSIVETFKM